MTKGKSFIYLMDKSIFLVNFKTFLTPFLFIFPRTWTWVHQFQKLIASYVHTKSSSESAPKTFFFVKIKKSEIKKFFWNREFLVKNWRKFFLICIHLSFWATKSKTAFHFINIFLLTKKRKNGKASQKCLKLLSKK